MSEMIPVPQFDRKLSIDEAIKLAQETGQKYINVPVETLATLKIAEQDTECLVSAWYECPQDSVPDVLQKVFLEIEARCLD
jgi:hypothetical protein